MDKPNFRQRLRYKFDNFMSRGGSAMFICLIVISFTALVVIGTTRGLVELPASVSAERGDGFFRQIYISFLQMTDPGNMAQDIESNPWLKLPAILAGLTGVVLLSMLIGFITTALATKMDDLRKGHSRVVEDDHTLILGWNDQRVVEIIRELIMANESEDSPAVVILADHPKEKMDDYLSLVLPDTENTRIVTRSGSASSLTNLKIAAVETARSAIVLASSSENGNEEEKTSSDAKTIKTILAVSTCRDKTNELNIVAELFNLEHLEIVQENCPHPITVADSNEILAKLIVQTSRSVGLSIAYSEILSFDGCEMYFESDDWGHITFGEIQFHFPDGVPMGIRSKDGQISINPLIDRPMESGDDILILAEDDSTIEFRRKAVATAQDLPLKSGRMEQHRENELVIGWNRKAAIIIEEYAEYVLDGSTVDVIVKAPSPEVREEISELNENLAPLTVQLIESDPLSKETLLALEPSKRDNIIILGSCDSKTDPEEADAQTILILLLLRRIFTEHPDETVNTRLITEVMDSANQGLISQAGVKDFIISNRFISMILAQISEGADIKRVYDHLFSEDGSEVYLKPISTYLEDIPGKVTFADCMKIAQKREEVCLGVKIKALEDSEDDNFGVKLIPDKNTSYQFKADDCLVVLSEDET